MAERTEDSGETEGSGETEDGRDEEMRHYETTVSPFVERFAADLTEAGMQRMAARVFACLLASDDGALTSAQLTERLQASPAAVSGAVRYLAQVNMVSRQRDPGSRRERYLLHRDVWFSALTNRDNVLTRWTGTLREGAHDVGADTAAGRRIQESAEFLEYARIELDSLLQRWHASRSPERD